MKKSTMKMLALLLLAAMMLAAFTACGSNEAPSTSPVPPAETTEKPAASSAETEPVTINFWHHYSAQSAENETLMNVLIPRFEEENPGIKVNAVSHEWADLHDKILISAQSNTLPDVARLDIAWVPEFQKMGILTALDEEMADFDSVTADLLESAMSTGFVSGHYYAMALNTNTKILFYNEKALEEAGVAVPATMDEFVKAVAAVSGKNSRTDGLGSQRARARRLERPAVHLVERRRDHERGQYQGQRLHQQRKDDRCRADARGYGEERRAFRLQQR